MKKEYVSNCCSAELILKEATTKHYSCSDCKEPCSPEIIEEKDGYSAPAIPEPYYYFIGVGCDCGEFFLNKKKYRKHYALRHILEIK